MSKYKLNGEPVFTFSVPGGLLAPLPTHPWCNWSYMWHVSYY